MQTKGGSMANLKIFDTISDAINYRYREKSSKYISFKIGIYFYISIQGSSGGSIKSESGNNHLYDPALLSRWHLLLSGNSACYFWPKFFSLDIFSSKGFQTVIFIFIYTYKECFRVWIMFKGEISPNWCWTTLGMT